MKAKDIKIGGVYMVRVRNKLVRCKVLREIHYQSKGTWDAIRWECRNEITERIIEIKSVKRFRYVSTEKLSNSSD